MKQSLTLTVNQIQKLALTPDLRLSLAILQMPFPELEAYLAQQLLENCLLEPEEAADPEEGLVPNLTADRLETGGTYETGFLNGSDSLFEEGESEAAFTNPAHPFEIMDSSALSLQEYLISQLHISNLPQKSCRIAEFLIGNIDEDGYLRVELPETAAHFQIPLQSAENLLHLIQTFEPPGVGARTIEECLLLQLHFKKEQSGAASFQKSLFELAQAIIGENLPDLAAGKLVKIAKRLNASLPEVQAAVELIRSFDPKPGRNFGGSQPIRFITPDVIVRKIDDEYLILINEPANARLTVSPFYRRLVQNRNAIDETTIKFIKDKQNAALLLIKCIEQRKLTLWRVTESIINLQKDFLEKGVLALKPLTLRQIAAAVGIHESTVSRAMAEKYLETPKGIYPFKFFFSAGLDSGNGNEVSAESVKKLIKTAIAAEDQKAPLSDQALTELLNGKGIAISRRTVAKYREEIKILSSNKRRRC